MPLPVRVTTSEADGLPPSSTVVNGRPAAEPGDVERIVAVQSLGVVAAATPGNVDRNLLIERDDANY